MNKKLRRLIILVAIISVSLWFIQQFGGKSQSRFIEDAIASCTRNLPFTDWQQDLKTVNAQADPQQVAAAYCRCAIGNPLKRLSTDDIKALPQMNREERLATLGGSDYLDQVAKDCLKRSTSP